LWAISAWIWKSRHRVTASNINSSGFPKCKCEIAPISNSPFSIPLNPFTRFSAFESDICVIIPAGWCPQIFAVSNLLGNRLHARLITDVKGSTYWKMWSRSNLRKRRAIQSDREDRGMVLSFAQPDFKPCSHSNLLTT